MALEIKSVAAPAGDLCELISRLSEDLDNGIEKIGAVLSMRMTQYSDISLTPDEADKIGNEFLNIELGSSTGLVMICDKSKCMYKSRCTLYSVNKCPNGKECVHENKILTDALGKYLVSLKIETDNYAEMVIVNQLVEYELMEHRCNAILSNIHTNLRMKSIIGLDKDGNIVEKEEVSHALTIKMQLQKSKMALLQELTATRKEIYKKQAALKEVKDGPIKTISSLKKKLQSAKQKSVTSEDVHDKLNALQDLEI